MVDQGLFNRTLAEFARTLVSGYDISEVLYDLSERVAGVLGVTGAGVTLSDDQDQLRFAAASPGSIADLERVQERRQEGPCRDAYTLGHPVMVPDLRADGERWGDFKREAALHELRAAAGIPLHIEHERVGALNLYHAEPRVWSEEELATAGVLAAIATSYLLNASKLARAQRTAEQLQHALDSRIVIEQAKGILANHHSISMDEAFARLRDHARSHNATVGSVADAVVKLGLRP